MKMKTTFAIQNLKCGGCANTIEKKLNSIDGISDITIDVEESTVSFTHETDEAIEVVHKSLSKLGYPIVGDVNTLGDKAKSYVSCAIGRINS